MLRRKIQQTVTAALEEITADSMLDVIGQEETMRRLMGEDKGLPRKIMDWLGDIMRELQGMLKSLAQYSPETNAMLKQQMESMQAIQEMYRKGMEQAAENYKAAKGPPAARSRTPTCRNTWRPWKRERTGRRR